jgi:hypothetical protein
MKIHGNFTLSQNFKRFVKNVAKFHGNLEKKNWFPPHWKVNDLV